MDKEKVCPYCQGKKFIGTGFKEIIEKGHKTLYPYTEPCYCVVNKAINKKFGMLIGVGDARPEDSNEVRRRWGKGDFIMYGKEKLFLYIVKSYFLNGFMNKNFMLLEGGTIVERYNTPRPDGEWLSPTHLSQYDMLAILFTTSARYPTLKECVLEVIKNRSRLGVPTWVYARSEEKEKIANEYSDGLEAYFEDYRKVALTKCAFLKGYKPKDMATIADNNTIAVNDLASK